MMRFASSSSSSLQLFAAAAATEARMSSSSRASSRGGRNPYTWSRGFCDRPPKRGRDAFVSGDSHLRSVRDANYSARQGDGGNFSNSGSGGYQGQTFYPPPHFHQPQPNSHQQQPIYPPPHFHPNSHQQQPFYPPPHFHQPQPNAHHGQPFYPPPHISQPLPNTHNRQPLYPPPHFRQPLPIRPQRKALDHRNWEYALSQPPSDCERFVVLSYNILADYLALKHRHELYFHIPRHILDWEWRREKIVRELGLWSPDILCLQEVDRFQDLEEPLKLRGYDGIWKMRTGLPVDGCAIFWRTTRFELRHEEYIEFNKLGLRDNVAQICVLKSKNRHPAIDESTASPTSSSDANHVVICNIHVLYNPRRGEIKLGQARVLLDRAHAVSRMWNDAPVVVCGDFNCTPKSPLYNFISEQKLDVTGFPRDQISGQKTAQIYPPRTYYLNPEHGLQRTQSPNNFVGTSMLVDEKDIDMKHNHTPDTQNHYKPCSDMKNASSQEISSQPQNITPVLHMSQKSGSVGKCHDESKMIPHATIEERQQDLIDIFRDKFVLNHDIPVGPSMESPSNNQEEGVAAVDLENVAVQELIPEVTSSREDTTAHFIQESFYEHSQSNLCSNMANASLQNESVSDDMRKGSLELKESTPSTKVDVNCTEAGHNEKPVDAFISDIPLYDLVSETSSPEDVEVCVPGDFSSSMAANQERADPSTSADSTIHVNISDASCVNLNLDQKLVDFSPDKFGEVTEKGHVGHYPGGTFSSDTSGTDDVSPFNGDSNSTFIRPESAEADQLSDKYSITTHTSDLPSPGTEVLNYAPPSMNSQPVNMERNAYDPSLWTPMEIETATGNAECTLVEHRLKLKSTYAEVEDYSETRDSSREPQVTSYHRRFMGTVDYIWCSEGLQTVKVLDTIPKRGMQWTPGFPTPKWGSDHIALVSQLAFKKGVDHS